MYVRRDLRDERGGILALSAMVIPIFIVLVALAVDAGTWFTHKRQLQNRADAAALAAGVEYGVRWAACGGTPADKAAAETAIDTAARIYAGDPATSGTLHNTEVTEQARVNVEINSSSRVVDPNTSWNDTGINGLGPCDNHPTGDTFSPANRYWVDVAVREQNQTSLFGMFGLDLLNNRAHARVQLMPALAGTGFLPLAVPEVDIRQAQIRYYNYCDPSNPTFMTKATLRTLGSAYQNAGAGTTLWGPTVGDANGAAPTGLTITMPDADACGGDAGPYIPVVAEVRIAGVDPGVIDIDASTCAQLVAARFADCWTGLSNIRVFKDSPSTEPWFQEASVSGGTCSPDGYFAVTTPAGDCTFSGSVVIDFNDIGGGGVAPGDVDVSIAGAAATYSGGAGFTFPDGLWTMNGTATNSVSGRSNVAVDWCVHPGPGNCKSSGANQDPNGTKIVQAVYRNNNIAPVLNMVRTSGSVQASGAQPGAPLDWFRAQPTATVATIYPTVGLESSLYVGQKRTLRLPHCKTGNSDTNDCSLDLGAPNNSQSIDCEPETGGQGHDFQMFATGCDPWYTDNKFTGAPWWFPSPPGPPPAPGSCPDKNGIIAQQPNSETQAWECVVKAPGFSPPVIANGIAAAIGNCANLNNNSCQSYACTNPNYYNPAQPDQWALQGGEPSERVVFLFIVPYGAYKNTGPQDGLPILNFAAFYITGWEGQGNGGPNQNPCESPQFVDPDGTGPAIPDEPMGSSGGDVVGYFVDWTMPSAPGDPNSQCIIGQLRPCVPVLVR